MKNNQVWVITCYSRKQGRYPRFFSRAKESIHAILKDLQKNEPDTSPMLELFEIVPAVTESTGMQAWVVLQGDYPRFAGVNRERMEFWLRWLQCQEPHTSPSLELFDLIRVRPGIIVEAVG
jgi:hypothetical protein